MKQSIYILFLFILFTANSLAQTISNTGNVFDPDTLLVNVGDTITFNISNNHNAVEVSENTWELNEGDANNGFNIPFGGGSWIADSIGTYYYVCQPHVNIGMKGVIISNPPPCNKSLTQNLNNFNPSPVYAPWVWSYDTLTLTNTSNCDVRIRSEFDISHDNLAIESTDFDLKWHNPIFGIWTSIPYDINANGHAVGYWSFAAGDTIGQIMTQGSTQQIIIKVRFRPSANYGTYFAIWKTNEVDANGAFMQNLATDSTNLSLVDCTIFEIDSSYSSNITCINAINGNASILSIQNGSNEYLYNWSNGDTTNTINNLTPGDYYCIVTDKNWQECTDSIGFSITNPDSIITTTTSTSTNCFGGNNGTVSIDIISGGMAPFNFSINNGLNFQNSNIFNNLFAGSYSFLISDINGCLSFTSVDVIEPDEIINTISVINASCYTNCDGSISVITNGGAPPYTYTWNNEQSTQTATGLCAGFYNVTTTDSNNCSVINSAIVNEPNPLLINIWLNGSGLVATNGFSTYQWHTVSGIPIPGATSAFFNPSSMGEYYVVVTNNNCEEESYVINYNISELNDLDNSIQIYPNPTNGLLTIEGINTIHNITVMTSIGNKLLKVENNNNEVSSTKLDLSIFAKGIYFMQIEQNNQIMNYRIILQ